MPSRRACPPAARLTPRSSRSRYASTQSSAQPCVPRRSSAAYGGQVHRRNRSQSSPRRPPYDANSAGASSHSAGACRVLAFAAARTAARTSGAGRGDRLRTSRHGTGCDRGAGWRYAEPTGSRDVPLPAPARGQPRRLVAVVGRGLRGGTQERQTGSAQRRLQQLSLVSRDGPRVLRGPGDRRLPQRPLRQRQGRPRGTPRRGRRLHGGRPGGHRPGRLAHDGVPHAGRRAVLLRHLLPAGSPAGHAVLPAGAGGRAQRLGEPAGRGRRRRGEDRAGPRRAGDLLRRHRGAR